jgi:hypothetical protein
MQIIDSMKKALTICLLIISTGVWAIGPWVNATGSMFTQTSFLYLRYNQIFGSNNLVEKTKNGFVSDLALRNYTEYSITDRTLLTSILTLRSASYNGKTIAGLSDIRIGGKTELFPKNSPLALYYTAFIPTGIHKNELRTDYKAWGAEMGLATGFAVNKVYAQLSGGYRVRIEIPDQAIFEFEIGRAFLVRQQKLYVVFNFDGAINSEVIKYNAVPSFDATQLYHPNAQYLSPGFKFLYNVKRNWWITATTKFGVFARNIGAFPGLDLGIAYKREK